MAGAALMAVGALSPVHAQDAKQPPPDIRMLLSQPQNHIPSDATSAPSLKDLPQPKMDKPPVEPLITIMVGDPRCYPGEDGLQPLPFTRRRNR